MFILGPLQTVEQQMARWAEFLDHWERALNTGLEVHTLGDMNLNHCNWTDESLPATNQTSRLRPLITALFSQIFPHGVTQCVTGPTRHWPNQPSSGLDHYFTNRPDKLSPVEKQFRGGSDHMFIFAVRYAILDQDGTNENCTDQDQIYSLVIPVY